MVARRSAVDRRRTGAARSWAAHRRRQAVSALDQLIKIRTSGPGDLVRHSVNQLLKVRNVGE
jgi:hypothetical protein